MELINLKIISSENPMILKGSSSNQSSGKANSRISASGQQSVNRIHQSKMASKVFMEKFSVPKANYLPRIKSWLGLNGGGIFSSTLQI
jgi:hypothetical protein